MKRLSANVKTCAAIAKSTGEACKKRNIPGFRYCFWHADKVSVVASALVGIFLGYLAAWLLPSPELVELRHLRADVQPLIFLAQSRFPNLETPEALSELAKEVAILRAKVAENEFTPLSDELRVTMLGRLAPVSASFNESNIRISITYESWVSPQAREFANHLAILLRDAGFSVAGPDTAAVYLIGPSYPFELGFSDNQEAQASKLYEALSGVIEHDASYAKRRALPAGEIRLHFAGKPVFRDNGMVVIK